MRDLIRGVLFGILALVLAGAPLWAQATAGISGTVRDESGAVLPGVTITATQTDTGLVRTTVSNETGSYTLPSLPLGPYRIEATLQGFRTFAQTGVVLQVNSNPVINPTLGLGTVAEEIQVTATAQMVDTRTVGVGTVVESERIVELPLNARQVTQLIMLSGLAVQTSSSPAWSMNTGVNISVAGSSGGGVSYSLDGAPHLNAFDGTGLHLPFPDALQEFRLTTGAQEAGGTIRAGAAVNAVTKSGTNTVHGSGFEFLRDSRFNAPDFFSGKKDGLKRNQFGGTIGGPITRDKLFFFAALQMTTTRQNPLDQQTFVPTAAMLAGDFTTFTSPACNNGRQINLGAPFVNNRIDPSLISPAALNVARKLPTPIDACGKVFWGSPVHQNESQVPVRIDFQPNARHSIMGRFMLTTDNVDVPFDLSGGNALATANPGVDDRAINVTVGHTWVISPAMVNNFRVLANDINANKLGAKFVGPADVGINAYSYVPGATRVTVGGGAFTVGAGFGANVTLQAKSAGVSNDLTMLKGAHQFAFGGHYLWTTSDEVANAWSTGAYTFTGAFTGNPMADFIAGRVGVHRQGNPNPVNVTQPMPSAYAQDTWKLNRVTLTYGAVWNPFLPMSFVESDAYNFSLDAFNKGIRSSVMKNAPPGFSYTGDPGFEGTSGVKRHLNAWDPRAGVAWDVTGDGRTAVRAGFGMGHDYINQQIHLNTSSVSPFRLTVQLPSGSSLDNPWANYPGGNPFPYTYNAANPVFPAYAAYLPLPADLKPTVQYSWNASLQRQLTRRLFASATYIGTKIVNQMTAEEQNPALNLGFGPCSLYDATIGTERSYPVCTVANNVNQRRVLNLANRSVALGYVTQYSDKGYQDYRGMLLNTRVDFGRYLNLNANYTLSNCEGIAALGSTLNPGQNYIHQPYQNNGTSDIALDEGPCASDRRHLFNLTSVFRTPDFNGVLGLLVSDWTASSVIQIRSGAPVNVTTGLDNALNGFTAQASSQRPNVVAGVDPYGDKDALSGYYNIAAFSLPAAGTFGDASFNLLRGPGFWQWDQSFVRGFAFGGGNRVELRAEGINLVNHFNRGNPAAAMNNPATFGRITTQATGATPRIWQFAVKYTF